MWKIEIGREGQNKG